MVTVAAVVPEQNGSCFQVHVRHRDIQITVVVCVPYDRASSRPRAPEVRRQGRPDIREVSCAVVLKQERQLLLKLAEMPEALLHSYETRAPNHLCEYIYNLAATFNRFLGQCHILREEDDARQGSWLSLANYYVTLMEMLLSLIMIDVPERM